jgi:hypothetical protein
VKVLLVANNDWANLGYILSQCLKQVGIESDMLVKNKHIYRYPEHGIYFRSVDQVKQYAKKADIIQFMHSQWVDTGIDLSKKRVFVFHGGGVYLRLHKKLNKLFNPIVEKSIIQTGNLFNLGAENEVWLLPAVDVNNLKPVYERHSDKIIIGHFPSSSITKNSDGINKVIERLKQDIPHKFEYVFSPITVPWGKQMERVAKCDIYIEACSLEVKTKKYPVAVKYGEWGLAGLEAAALGDVVISHFLSHDFYEREYGNHCIRVSNSLDEIENHLRQLLTFSDDKLLQAKKDTRAWVEKFHSYYMVGKRLKDVVYEI